MSTLNRTSNATKLPAFLTLPEVVEHSRFSIDTVRKAIKDGRLRASQPEGREYRVAAVDYLSWMAGLPPYGEDLGWNLDGTLITSTSPPERDPTAGVDPIVFLRLDLPANYEGNLPWEWDLVSLSFRQGFRVVGTVITVDRKAVLIRVVHPYSDLLIQHYGLGPRFCVKMAADMFGSLPLFSRGPTETLEQPEPVYGAAVADYIIALIGRAKSKNIRVIGNFNGIRIVADSSSDPKDVENLYWSEVKKDSLPPSKKESK